MVISDCNMPGMSGYELARAIRRIEEQEQRAACVIIGCTANAISDERQHDLLVKPVLLDDLTRLLAQIDPREKSFDLQTLRSMTQADAAVLQHMLLELWKNLRDERRELQTLVDQDDWDGVAAGVHRLKGIACLVDAIALAQACVDMDRCVKLRRTERLRAHWPVLKAVRKNRHFRTCPMGNTNRDG